MQEIANQAKLQIMQTIKQLCADLDRTKGNDLRKLCEEFACKMWLVVEEEGNNPFMIRPILYVFIIGTDSPSKKKTWLKLVEKLGTWASDNRVTLKLIDNAYDGTAEFNYP